MLFTNVWFAPSANAQTATDEPPATTAPSETTVPVEVPTGSTTTVPALPPPQPTSTTNPTTLQTTSPSSSTSPSSTTTAARSGEPIVDGEAPLSIDENERANEAEQPVPAVGPDPCVTGCDLGTGVLFRQWYLDQLGAGANPAITANGVVVAIIDGGVQLDHPDLAGNVVRAECAPADVSNLDLEHGTNVAGLIAATTGDAAGLAAAVPGIIVLDVPVFDSSTDNSAGTSAAAIAAGIDCAIASQVDVINLSMAGSCADSDDLRFAVEAAESAGIVVVAAAGNAELLSEPCPAAFPTVLSAGAVSRDLDVVVGTTWADVALPGIELMTTSTNADRPRTLVTGTSFAAPLLASGVAAILAAHPTWSASRVRARVLATAGSSTDGWLPQLIEGGLGVVSVTASGAVTSAGDAAGTFSVPTSSAVDIVTGACGGLYVAAADGGVFAIDGARFRGSLGGIDLAAPVVAMALTPSGAGYWLFGADGGVFTFGDAEFFGSLGAIALSSPIVDAAAPASGRGYLLLGSDGQIYAFGDAAHGGAIVNSGSAMVAIVAVDGGYMLVRSDGHVVLLGARLRSWFIPLASRVVDAFEVGGDPVLVGGGGEVAAGISGSRLVASSGVVAAARASSDTECSDLQ